MYNYLWIANQIFTGSILTYDSKPEKLLNGNTIEITRSDSQGSANLK